MYLTFDDAKDAANLRKHGLSLADAGLVYEAANKLTVAARQGDEARKVDVAFVQSLGLFLALVYVERGEQVRAIRYVVHRGRNGGAMPTRRKSEWDRVRREARSDAKISHDREDGPYDPNDPKAVDAYWSSASVVRGPGRPRKAITRTMVSLRIDPDVLAALRATGRGWQTRVNALLREAVKKGRV